MIHIDLETLPTWDPFYVGEYPFKPRHRTYRWKQYAWLPTRMSDGGWVWLGWYQIVDTTTYFMGRDYASSYFAARTVSKVAYSPYVERMDT